jgi:hypothetical protein
MAPKTRIPIPPPRVAGAIATSPRKPVAAPAAALAPAVATVAKPAAVAPAAAPAAPAAAPTRRRNSRRRGDGTRPRKPLIKRALLLAQKISTCETKLSAIVTSWHGEATEEQAERCVQLATDLPTLTDIAAQINAHVTLLHESGFSPQGTPRVLRASVMPGKAVQIKAKHYVVAVFGSNTDLEVVEQRDKYLVLRHTDNPRAPQLVVARAMVEARKVTGDTAELSSEEFEGEGVGEGAAVEDAEDAEDEEEIDEESDDADEADDEEA